MLMPSTEFESLLELMSAREPFPEDDVLAMATLLALRDAGLPMPAAGVCMSPWVDLECAGESVTTRAELDPMVTGGLLKRMADWYLAGGDARAPLASPLHGDLAGLPPLL